MKRFIAAILSITVLCSINSCSRSTSDKNTAINEIFNNYSCVPMNNEAIYFGVNSRPSIVDFATMETALLCNIPNCTHLTSGCVVSALTGLAPHLPTVYENCAYYFSNSSDMKETDGKRVLALKTNVMKYDFKKMEISKFAEIDGMNAEINGGAYLIGNELYFITTFGNPKYDEAGNVISYSSGGGGNLCSINLETGDISDYGEIFDYDALKSEIPLAAYSTSVRISGKIKNEIYISVAYLETENSPWSGFTYTFNLKTKEYKKANDYLSVWNSNGYKTYLDNEILYLSKADSDEFIAGPHVIAFNSVAVFDERVWYESKCYDIAAGVSETVSDLECATCIGVYEDSYIMKGTDDTGKTVFEKIPCEEIDNLFAE